METTWRRNNVYCLLPFANTNSVSRYLAALSVVSQPDPMEVITSALTMLNSSSFVLYSHRDHEFSYVLRWGSV